MIEGYAIRVHTSIAAARDDLATPGLAGYGFQTEAWLGAWETSFGRRPGLRILVVSVVADDRVRMIVPLCLQKSSGVRAIGFAGDVVTDYHAPRIDPDFAAALGDVDLAALWTLILTALPPHDLVRLERMPALIDAADGGTALANPMVRLAGAQATATTFSLTLPTSYVDVLARLRTRFVADSRRRMRRLQEQGPVSVTVATNDAQRDAILGRLMPMKSQRWRETGAPDEARNARFVAFYAALAHAQTPDLIVHASELTCGAEAIAAHLGIVYRSRFYQLLFGWGGDRSFSPGRLLVGELIRTSIDDGLGLFDFTVGEDSYKREWANQTMDLYTLEVARSRRGRTVLAATAAVERLRARLKRITVLRALVRRLSGRPRLADA